MTGELLYIRKPNGGTPLNATDCYSPTEAEDLTDPSSAAFQLLVAKAIIACQDRAAELNAVDDTCEASVIDPFYVTACELPSSECDGPVSGDDSGSGGGGEETGETGDGPFTPGLFESLSP